MLLNVARYAIQSFDDFINWDPIIEFESEAWSGTKSGTVKDAK